MEKEKKAGENGRMPDVCQVRCVHNDAVERVISSMHPSDMLLDLSLLFKVFGDHTRIRILDALYQEELCVCDLVAVLGMNQSAVSHQLRVLRSAHIVKFRRKGKMVYYSLDDQHVYQLLRDGMAHIREARDG